MKVSGTATLQAPVEKVWESLLDPQVLVATIPGCESLSETGPNEYAATITAGVASIKGTYQGKVKLSDLKPHDSLMMHAEGSGAPGTISVDVEVRFTAESDSVTRIDYDADAIVGGMIGGVGQRMLTSVSKRMSKEFFGAVDKVLAGQTPVGAAPSAASPAPSGGSDEAVPTAAAQPAGGTFGVPAAAGSNAGDLVKGLIAGAAIALIGVVVGALASRRR